MIRAREAIEQAARALAAAGVDEPRADAERLLAAVLGTDRWRVRLDEDRPLADDAVAAFRARVERRARREPLQYVVGECEFHGLAFRVDRRALIPRPETEGIVDAVAAAARAGLLPEAAVVADVGTGSGCLAVTLAHAHPGWRVIACDLSADALALARENAARHGVAERIEFRHGDGIAPLAGVALDLLVSNPPYLADDEIAGLEPEVRDGEPRLALAAGTDGLAVIRRLVAEAPGVLRPGGRLVMEIGWQQAAAVRALLAAEPAWGPATFHRDLQGIERVVDVVRRS